MENQPDYTVRLSDTQLAHLRAYALAATPGPYELGIHTSVNIYEAMGFAADCIRKGPGSTVYLVYVGEPADCVIVALTGNGPRAEANAHALCNVLNALPYLLDEIIAGRVQTQPPTGPTPDAGGEG